MLCADRALSSQLRGLTVCCAASLATLTLIFVFAAQGCASASRSADGAHRTMGAAIDLFVDHADGRRAFYRVFPDGSLGFGGGNDARTRRVAWTGVMTDEQAAKLRQLIDEHGWHTHHPEPGPNTDRVTFRIDLRSSDGRRRYTVNGESPDVVPVYNYLHEIAMQRFEHVIETLPQPDSESSRP